MTCQAQHIIAKALLVKYQDGPQSVCVFYLACFATLLL